MSVSTTGLGSFFPTPKKRGQASLYVGGGSSKLASGGEPDDAQQGAFSRKQLMRMNDRFVAAMERAIARGLEVAPVTLERSTLELRPGRELSSS